MSDLAQLGFQVDSSQLRSANRELGTLSTQGAAASKAALALKASIVGAGAALAAMTVQGLRAVDSQAKLSRQLGGTINGLKALNIAASDAGIAQGVMGSALERLNARLGEAQRGTGEAAKSFKRLGVNAKDLAKLDIDQRMAALADAMKNSGLSTAQAADELRQMGIRQGELVNLMTQGGDAIRNARKEVVDYGLALSAVDAAKVEAANDSFSRVGMQMDALSEQLAVSVAPTLDAISKSISGAAKEAGGLSSAIETMATVAGAAAVVVGAKLAGSATASASAMLAAQIQAIRYQAALASMAGVSRGAAASQVVLAGSVRMAGASMAFLGGPVGVAITAAAALLYFANKLEPISRMATHTSDQIDTLAGSMSDMTAESLKAELIDVTIEMSKMTSAQEAAQVSSRKIASSNSFLGGTIAEVRENLELTTAATKVEQVEVDKLRLRQMALGRALDILNEKRSKPAEDDAASAAAAAEAASKMVLALKEQEIQLALTAEQWVVYKLAQAGASASQIEEGVAAFQAADALRATAEANKATAETAKAAAAATDEQAESLRDALDPLGKFHSDALEIWELFQDGLLGDATAEQVSELIEKMKPLEEAGKAVFTGPGQAIDDFAQGTAKTVGIMQGMFEQGSDGYNAMSIALSALNAMQAVNAVLNQTAGDPYSAPARMAMMAAAVAQLGYAVGGALGGGMGDPTADRQASQGTGTVFGDLDAKSESIANAIELTADSTSELVNINIEMLRALQTLQTGIGGAAVMVARGAKAAQSGFAAPEVTENFFESSPLLGGGLGGQMSADPFGIFDIAGGLFDAVGKILGGRSEKVDSGIIILGGQIADMSEEAIVQAFSTFRVKKNFYSSTETQEQVSRIGGDVEQQFALVFGAVIDSVAAGASALGLLPTEIESAINDFAVETTRISLENLNAEQQREELAAVFGTIFDNLAGGVVPFLDQFQQAGEGLGETLARVATEVGIMNEAIGTLGLAVSSTDPETVAQVATSLSALLGGAEQFANAVVTFEKEFLTEAEQFENLSRRLGQALGDLPLLETRQGFADLLQSQNQYTLAGQENIATLLRLQDTADDYYDQLEKQADKLLSAARSAEDQAFSNLASAASAFSAKSLEQQLVLLRLAGDETAALNIERENELAVMDEALRPFQQRIWQLQEEQVALDEATAAGQAYSQALAQARIDLQGVLTGISGWIDSQRATGGTPSANLQASQSQFASQLALARGGDRDALQGLTQSADQLLQAGLSTAGSETDYQRIRKGILGALEGMPEQVSAEQFIADEIRQALVDTVGALPGGIAEALAPLFDSIDLNADGLVDYAEFGKYFKGLATDAELKEVFRTLDTDGSGTITAIEAVKGSTDKSVTATNTVAGRALEQLTALGLLTGEMARTTDQFAGLNTTMSSLQQSINALGVTQAEVARIEKERLAAAAAEKVRIETARKESSDTALRTQATQLASGGSAADIAAFDVGSLSNVSGTSGVAAQLLKDQALIKKGRSAAQGFGSLSDMQFKDEYLGRSQKAGANSDYKALMSSVKDMQIYASRFGSESQQAALDRFRGQIGVTFGTAESWHKGGYRGRRAERFDQGASGAWGAIQAMDIPMFATGGITSGISIAGEAGPEAIVPLPNGRSIPVQMTGPAQSSSNTELLTGLSAEMLSEMKALRNETRDAQRSIAKHTAKTAKQLERWDVAGLPEERVLA